MSDHLPTLDAEQRALLAVLLEQQGLNDVILPRIDTSPAPLSPAQRRLWLIDQIAAEAGVPSPNTNIRAWRIRGSLDPMRLSVAMNSLVERHAVLRTAIRVDDDGPVQVVQPRPMEILALEPAPAETESTQRIATVIDRERTRPISLSDGLLIRGSLVTLAEDDHLLVFVMHYMAADGVAEGMLLTELSELYNGSAPDEPALQYADYAVWRQGWWERGDAQPHFDALRDLLRDAPPYLRRAASPAGAPLSFAGRSEAFEIGAEQATALRQTAAALGVTPFTLLFAAVQSVLRALTGSTDIVAATTVSDRSLPGLESMLGTFSNNVLVRAHIDEDATLAEVVAATQSSLATAMAHQSVAYEEMVETFVRDGITPPAVEVVFVLHDHDPAHDLQLNGLAVESIEIPRTTSAFDLHVRAISTSTRYVVRVDYRETAFEAADVATFCAALARVIEACTADPQTRLALLDLPRFPERQPAAPRAPLRPRTAGDDAVTEVERLLLKAWSEVLPNVGSVSVSENLFDLGARSLQVTRVRSTLEQALGRPVPIVAFFEHPTIRELAQHLDGNIETTTGEGASRARLRRESRRRGRAAG